MGFKDRIKDLYWLEAFIVSFVTGGFWFFADNPDLIPNSQVPKIPAIQTISLGVSLVSLAVGMVLLYLNVSTTISAEGSDESQGSMSENSKKTAGIDSSINPSDIDSASQVNRDATSGDEASTGDFIDDLIEENSSRISDPHSIYGEVFLLKENGEIVFGTEGPRDISSARKILIFLIGKRYAYEANLISDPYFTTSEIARGCDLSRLTVHRWISEISDYLSIKQRGKKSVYSVEIENAKDALLRIG
jgi:hypothetical protein